MNIATIRTLKESLVSSAIAPASSKPVEAHLTVSGVVIQGNCFIHPESYRETFGEEAYQELLAKPRVVCSYDYGSHR